MAQYSSFYEAYKAKNPTYDPWSSQQKQQLADAYSAKNPTWTPTQDAASVKVNPVEFNPYADSGFVLGAAGINQANANADANYNYGILHGEQASGIYSGGPLRGQVINDSAYAGYNPFSQAAQLQRSYDNAKRGTTNSYAASGQLYSGALNNAQADNTYNYNRSSDSLIRSATDSYNNLAANKQATKTQGQQQFAQYVMDALNRFLSSQQG